MVSFVRLLSDLSGVGVLIVFDYYDLYPFIVLHVICRVLIGQGSDCLFCAWGVACSTCNLPCANQAVLSQLHAAVALFAHELSHVLSFARL